MIPTLLILFAVAQAIYAFRSTRGQFCEADVVRARQVRFSAAIAFVLLVITAWFVYRMEWL